MPDSAGDDELFEYVEPVRAMSPCVDICTIDTDTDWCIGCGRTLDEIACWSTVDDAGRQAILDGLPNRMAILTG